MKLSTHEQSKLSYDCNGFTIDVIVGFLKSIVTGEVKKVQHDLFSLGTS